MAMRFLRFALPVAILLALSAAVAADPLYGPRSFETAGPAVPHHDTFDVSAATTALVWIQSGDGEGNSRPTGGQVVVAGQLVAGAADFARPGDLFAKAVALPKGEISVDVVVEGGQDAMITIVVMPQNERPDVSVGRLLLPHADASGLTIALKNGARRARQVKVLFYDDAGEVVAWSHRFEIPGHGSIDGAFGSFIHEGSFTSGSIEVLWSGRGAGRLFGQATVHDDLSGVDSIVEMQQAGHKRIDAGSGLPSRHVSGNP
jgi:hypothetical protein